MGEYLAANAKTLEIGIKAIGNDLIERAKEISKLEIAKLEGVKSITIHAEILPTEIYNYSITLNKMVKCEKIKDDVEDIWKHIPTIDC